MNEPLNSTDFSLKGWSFVAGGKRPGAPGFERHPRFVTPMNRLHPGGVVVDPRPFPRPPLRGEDGFLFDHSGGVEDSTPGYERPPLRGEIGSSTLRSNPASQRSFTCSKRGFTLLEAVLALAILSAVAVVCVGVRAQSLASARRMEARHAEQRDTQAIFEMLTAGLLPPPESNTDSLIRRWTGDYQGAPYTLEATRTTRPNPVFRSDRKDADPLSDRIVMWRYTLKFRERETEFWWHK